MKPHIRSYIFGDQLPSHPSLLYQSLFAGCLELEYILGNYHSKTAEALFLAMPSCIRFQVTDLLVILFPSQVPSFIF